MKKFTSILTTAIIAATAFLAPILITATPVFACADGECSCGNGKCGTKISTSILDVCDCGGGEGIMYILNLAINILTAGIGVVAVIGIVIAGIQYLTAGGSEEQVKKAKRRIFEIVLGLAVYVLIYAILSWLIPDFNGINI